jgi:hypothetical protein
MVNYHSAYAHSKRGQTQPARATQDSRTVMLAGAEKFWEGPFLLKIKGQPGAPEAVLKPSRLEGQRDDHNLSPLYCEIMDER